MNKNKKKDVSGFFSEYKESKKEKQEKKEIPDINQYDTICIAYDKDDLSFVVHDNRILVGIQYDGDIDKVFNFMKIFTNPEAKVSNDIIYEEEKVLLNGKFVTSKVLKASAGKNGDHRLHIGDFIFKTNDNHFFVRSREEVGNPNYIEIPFEYASKMLRQNSFPTMGDSGRISRSDYGKEYYKVYDENLTKYAIAYPGSDFSAEVIDLILVALQTRFNMIKTYNFVDDGEDISIKYAFYRFVYYTDYLCFLVKYNIRNDDTPWLMYCDFPMIEVYPITDDKRIVLNPFSNNAIVFAHMSDGTNTVKAVKNRKTATRVLKYLENLDKK